VGSGKSGVRRTKAAISLKCVKIEAKLLWTAYRNSPMLFRTVLSPTPYGLPFLVIGGLQLSYPLLSRKKVKLRTSNLANPNKSPLKILQKMERGRIQGLPKFCGQHSFLVHFSFCFNSVLSN